MYLSQKQRFCIISILCLLDLALCWKIVLERPELVYINPKTLESSSSVKRTNRTTVALNVTFHVLQDIPLDARFHIDMFGFYSNAYRRLAVNIKRNLCDMFDFEYKLVKNDIKGHFPEKCPIHKGYYDIRNLVPSARFFPASPWTASQYYIEFTIMYQKIKQFQFRLYVRLERNALELR